MVNDLLANSSPALKYVCILWPLQPLNLLWQVFEYVILEGYKCYYLAYKKVVITNIYLCYSYTVILY